MVVFGLLTVVASLVESQALSAWASIVIALGLSSCGTWALVACGRWNLPRPGIELMSLPLAGGFFFFFWQVGSYPRHPQGSPQWLRYLCNWLFESGAQEDV